MESRGQKILLILKGGGKPPLHGSEESVDQTLEEPEVAAGDKADQHLLGHNEGGDQAANVALLLPLDVVQCVGDKYNDLIDK